MCVGCVWIWCVCVGFGWFFVWQVAQATTILSHGRFFDPLNKGGAFRNDTKEADLYREVAIGELVVSNVIYN